jgi:hypothetical protein
MGAGHEFVRHGASKLSISETTPTSFPTNFATEPRLLKCLAVALEPLERHGRKSRRLTRIQSGKPRGLITSSSKTPHNFHKLDRVDPELAADFPSLHARLRLYETPNPGVH